MRPMDGRIKALEEYMRSLSKSVEEMMTEIELLKKEVKRLKGD